MSKLREPRANGNQSQSKDAAATPEKSARQRIVRAAQHLLADRPPGMIINKDIAELAGIRQSLIYYYFASQEELFREAMTQLTDAYIDQRRKTVDRTEPFPRLVISDHELWWKAAANFSADSGQSYTRLRWGYPVVNFELEEILRHHPDLDVLEVKAHILREICFNFGWVRYRDTVAVGLHIDEHELREIEEKYFDHC